MYDFIFHTFFIVLIVVFVSFFEWADVFMREYQHAPKHIDRLRWRQTECLHPVHRLYVTESNPTACDDVDHLDFSTLHAWTMAWERSKSYLPWIFVHRFTVAPVLFFVFTVMFLYAVFARSKHSSPAGTLHHHHHHHHAL